LFKIGKRFNKWRGQRSRTTVQVAGPGGCIVATTAFCVSGIVAGTAQSPKSITVLAARTIIGIDNVVARTITINHRDEPRGNHISLNRPEFGARYSTQPEHHARAKLERYTRQRRRR
jgi:hypothetical protein